MCSSITPIFARNGSAELSSNLIARNKCHEHLVPRSSAASLTHFTNTLIQAVNSRS